MKITTFNPFIASSQPENVIKIFEELGFEKHHTKEGIEIADRKDTVFRMKDANGFYLDVLKSTENISRDISGIRINVDNFDEAYTMLLNKGFKNIYKDETVDTKTSKSAMLESPTGVNIALIQHLK